MTTAIALLAGGFALFGVVLAARLLDARAWARSLVALSLRLPSGLTPEDIAGWLTTVAAATHARRFALLSVPSVALEVVATRAGSASAPRTREDAGHRSE